MVPLTEIVVSACLIVSIFIFGLVIDLEAQRRIQDLQQAHPTHNASAQGLPAWPSTLPQEASSACLWQQPAKPTMDGARKIEFPGSLYFRSICETGSDAPSLTLKAKSISCRLWQQLEAYLEEQFVTKIQPMRGQPQTACVQAPAYPTEYI
ncbi:hypothetical protein SPRG_18704 [Saprolegnia parasitica CBS 223.65]|uniref:Uncharacterized protein n=1 Tax=Saprolegnia parasitica (strain CBS 223.65) TaxID=695850 RepID=A0A067BGA8_SAPPC|nr:hypothetical protein SPRG_18704 [Saprolegnia parasitica CBS 223.65]KDO15755.1 hypothetical protein SPRG_18704 [Saprolegnia parasitica CBS 223.65]|eukprot:XP_012213538.1 hypothetical protein SPRG_18704 [Saprolegnia parasitica CBS 223.65]